MKLRWLGILTATCSFLLTMTASAASCDWFIPSCESLNGTSTPTLNELSYSLNKYYWNTGTCITDSELGSYNIPGDDDCFLWRGESKDGTTNNFTDAQCEAGGQSPLNIPGVGNYGCICAAPQCVIKHVGSNNHIRESYFTSARTCTGTSCDAADPVGNYPSTSGTHSVPRYSHNVIGSVPLGAKIRVMVYSHNNATEQFPGDAQYNALLAHNVKPKITWSPGSLIGSISSSNAGNKTAPAITIPSIPSGTHYEVVGAWHHYNTATSAGMPSFTAVYSAPGSAELTTTSNSATYNIGDHASCYGNIHRVYFDLVVVKDPGCGDGIIQSSENCENNHAYFNTPCTPAYGGSCQWCDNCTLKTITGGSCGDATIQSPENCENNHAYFNTPCTPAYGGSCQWCDDCTLKTITGGSCGDGSIDSPSEQCDDGNTISNDGCSATCQNENTDFTITKTSVPTPGSQVTQGNTISYTLTANNTGNLLIPTLSITDTLDSNLTYVSGDTGVSHANGAVSITVSNLAVGASASYTFTVQVKNSAAGGIGVCNQAAAMAGNITRTSNQICHYTNTPLTFDLQKTALDLDGNVIPAGTAIMSGEKFDYRITLVRTGGGATLPINSFDVFDLLPSELLFVSSLNDTAITHSTNLDRTNVFIDFPIPAAGGTISKTFRVQVREGTPDTDFCNFAESSTANHLVTSNTICHGINQSGEDINLNKRALTLAGEEITPGSSIPAGTIIDFEITLTQDNTSVASVIKKLLASSFAKELKTQAVSTSVTVTDYLDGNLQYVGNNGDTSITHNNGVVTLTYNPPTPGTPQIKTFQVKVLHNISGQTDTFCNQASTNWEGRPVLSENICFDIPGVTGEITLTKESSVPSTENLKPGQDFQYIISLNNNTSAIQTITVYDILDPNIEFDINNPGNSGLTYDPATHTVTFDFTLVAPNSTVTKVLYVSVKDSIDQETIICNQASNQANTSTISSPPTSNTQEPTTSTPSPADTTAPEDSSLFDTILDAVKNAFKWLTGSLINPFTLEHLGNDVFTVTSELISEEICHTVIPTVTSLEKSVSTGSNSITNASILTYTIRFTSGEALPLTTTFTDSLDTNFTYIGNEVIAPSNPAVTGDITHDGSSNGGVVTLEVTNISRNQWIDFSFDVVTGDGELPYEICNQAYNNQWYSNIVCSPTTIGGGGGGGGAQTISTIGICSDLANGSLTCRKHTPHRSFGEDAYKDWKECKKLDSTNEGIESCTREWADRVGLLAIGECHPDHIATNQTVGGWRLDQGNGYVWMGTTEDDHDNECQVEIIEDCVPVSVCEEIEASITKETSTPAIAKDENASYSVEVQLENKATDPAAEVWITGMKVYDLTVPTDSGWVWDHDMGSGSADWTWVGRNEDPASNYFLWTGQNFQLEHQETLTIPLNYEMNTALSIYSDTAQVKNVAFVVVDYQVITRDAEGETFIKDGVFHLGGGSDPDAICENKLLSQILGSSSSQGATATVKIVRPYVEVRGGGNIGVQQMTELSEKPFGGLNTNSELADDISSGEILINGDSEPIQDTNTLFENSNIKEEANKEMDILGNTWDTTFDDSGVYFHTGDITLQGDFTGSKTFVIDGTLTIDQNFEPEGFGAFIANKIVVDSSVTKMIGIFIANDGEITANGTSDEQLVISGALMGDATNLLANRNFIGTDPMTQLESSIKIDYDLRLLDATPPALELFLSEDWTQTAE